MRGRSSKRRNRPTGGRDRALRGASSGVRSQGSVDVSKNVPARVVPAGVEALHAEVDALAARLAERHGARLRCGRGCDACCVDGLTVFEVEAERIRRAHPELLERGTPHPPGACAFLGDAGECRIYPDRPYVCRTQGLPLRWLEEAEGGETVERRDICPLNEAGEPLEGLPERECWTLGPFEERLRALQEAADGGAGQRVALREIFLRRRAAAGVC